MKFIKTKSFLNRFKERWAFDGVDLIDVEGVDYFRSKIFSSLLIFVQILLTPLFLYKLIEFLGDGNYFGVVVNILSLTLLFGLFKAKRTPEMIRRILMVLSIYLIGMIMIVEAGGQESGFVLVLLSLFAAGFFLDKEISIKFIFFNILGFITVTLALFNGVFDNRGIALLKATWHLNVVIVQFCGLVTLLLMNTMLNSLKKQSKQVKEANQEITISKRRYQEMIANIVDVIVITDVFGTIKYVSPNLDEIYGWTAEEFLDQPLLDKIYPDDQDLAKVTFARLLKSHKKKEFAQVRHLDKNKEIKYLEVTLTNLLDDPIISGILINYHDVTERWHFEKKITHINHHDELTGLYNRTYFNKIKNELNRQDDLPLSLMSADIDGLKRINDSFGHRAGDQILKTAARVFKETFRQNDIIARVGGDEFYIILPQTGQDDAAHLIDRINGQIDEYNEQNLDEAHYLIISMGMACKSDSHDDFDAILHVADQEMYQVKNKKKADLNAQIMASLKRVLYNKLPDREKKGQRWVDLSRKMGQAIGLSDEDLKRLELLSTLGDVGKIISQETKLVKEGLTKPDKKTCLCPENSYRIAKAVPDLSGIAECILAHEEKWDGSGYPRGLKEREIPLLARIRSLAVFCEEFEAEDQEKDWQKGEKIAALKAAAGSKYDPALLNVLISIL